MQLINHPTTTPEELIALDELLLAKAESGQMGESMRFWSAKEYFVALGRASKIDEDCFREKCNSDGIKIIRRMSGGGTVLQGPGCLNYSIILSYERDKKYKDIKHSYQCISDNIVTIFKEKGYDVRFFPTSDLTLGGKKISGNAQARKRRYFLHHGTFLFDFDLSKISQYLKYPPKEPDYRKGRRHEDFLTNIQIAPEEIGNIIEEAFSVSKKEGLSHLSRAKSRVDCPLFCKKDLEELIQKKYSSDDWNYAF